MEVVVESPRLAACYSLWKCFFNGMLLYGRPGNFPTLVPSVPCTNCATVQKEAKEPWAPEKKLSLLGSGERMVTAILQPFKLRCFWRRCSAPRWSTHKLLGITFFFSTGWKYSLWKSTEYFARKIRYEDVMLLINLTPEKWGGETCWPPYSSTEWEKIHWSWRE